MYYTWLSIEICLAFYIVRFQHSF